jgi:hypothetical protein
VGRARVASAAGPAAEDQSAAFLHSRGLLLANERFDQNCQLRSLNIPSKGTHFTPRPAHTSGILGFCGLSRSLRGNDRQTLYSG